MQHGFPDQLNAPSARRVRLRLHTRVCARVLNESFHTVVRLARAAAPPAGWLWRASFRSNLVWVHRYPS